MALTSGSALACTVTVPWPEDGETWEQAELRHEIDRQRTNWNLADGVFLAQVTESVDTGPSRGQVIATVKGSAGPPVIDILSGCGGGPPVGATQIVFAERRESGTWTTIDNLWPNEVRDPQLVDHLGRTAARLRSDHR
jgi:hypothetical protein